LTRAKHAEATGIIVLPPIMDRTISGTLVSPINAAFVDNSGFVIEGRDVTRIGQCGLQLLLSALSTGRMRGSSVTIHPSQAMLRAAEIAGLEAAFGWSGDGHDQ
jgi:anti-anti-sigma regulatory factor